MRTSKKALSAVMAGVIAFSAASQTAFTAFADDEFVEVENDVVYDEVEISWGFGSPDKYSEFTLVSADSSSITVGLTTASNITDYKLYLYDKTKGKYVLNQTESKDSIWYTGKMVLSGLNGGTTYKLKLVSLDKNGKKVKSETLTAKTLSKGPKAVMKNDGTKATFTWTPYQKNASGYEVYRCKVTNNYYWGYSITADNYKSEGYTLVSRRSTTSTAKITIKDGKDYYYIVRSFKIKDGKRVYSDFSTPVSTESCEAYINALKLKQTIYSSGEELELVKKYVSQVTNDKMTNYEKMKAIFDLCHSHGSYQDDITKIDGNRPVWQLMVKGEGQCATWAYSLHNMLEYAGFDVRTVRGLRPSGQQHFWCQIQLDGKWYDIDAHLGSFLTLYDGNYRDYVIQDYTN